MNCSLRRKQSRLAAVLKENRQLKARLAQFEKLFDFGLVR